MKVANLVIRLVENWDMRSAPKLDYQKVAKMESK